MAAVGHNRELLILLLLLLKMMMLMKKARLIEPPVQVLYLDQDVGVALLVLFDHVLEVVGLKGELEFVLGGKEFH